MNTGLIWYFDLLGIEWPITFSVIIILGVVATILLRKYIYINKVNKRTGTSDSFAENFNHKTTKSVFELFESTEIGLSTEEAEIRLKNYGKNQLPKSKPRSSLFRFLDQYLNVFIYVLIAESAITAMVGHWVDAYVILGVVIINALIGFIQEGKRIC